MNNLQKTRKSKGITQVELSVSSGIPLPTIKYLEKQTTDLRNCIYLTLEKLSKALKSKVEDLL